MSLVKLSTMPANRPVIEPADILTPEQLAERLQVAVSWIYKHTDRLPVLRCGRYLRFSWPDVCAWMRERK
jgi:hypothetical protein